MSNLQTPPPPLENTTCHHPFDTGEHQGQPLRRAWDVLRDGDLVIDALVLENMAKKNHKQNWILGRTGLSNVQYKSTFYKRILFDFLPDKSFILALIRLW